MHILPHNLGLGMELELELHVDEGVCPLSRCNWQMERRQKGSDGRRKIDSLPHILLFRADVIWPSVSITPPFALPLYPHHCAAQ